MKSSQLFITLLAFIAGGALVFTLKAATSVDDDSDLRDQLAATQAELEKLKAEMRAKPDDSKLSAALPVATPEKVEVVAEEDVEEEEDTPTMEDDPAAAIANMLNTKEARGFIKQMSAGFSKRGEQWIERGIAEYSEKLNLSDAQIASLKTRLTAQMKEQTDVFNSKLDDENLSMQEIIAEQRQVMMGQEDVMAEILKEELTEDQYAEFEREQLVEKTQRVQQDSDRELTRLNRDLELTDSQQDQVFGILVQTNSDYDESMAIEGADASLVVGEDQGKEDAIRSVLDAEQTEKYNESLEERRNRRGRWGGFGGGGFGR